MNYLLFDVCRERGGKTDRKVSGTMLFLLLSSLFLLAIDIGQVEATGTIYIRADGSIDPPTSLVSTIDNVTYTFTGNITSDANGIVVERNNTILDGRGYALQGTGDGIGVDLSHNSNVTVENMEIAKFSNAILLNYSSSNRISGNNITNNGAGISLKYSSNNNGVSENRITANTGYGIYLLSSCCGNSIFENIMTNNNRGIDLDSSCNNNGILANIVTNNVRGIDLDSSSNNSILGNTVTANDGTGIHLESSCNSSTISGNSVTDNGYGLAVKYSCGSNSIFGNNITNNGTGIRLESSSDNSFYHNNIMNNTDQVYSYNSANVWDDGYPSGGNYWSDYAGVDVKRGPYENETGSDGIGDTSYAIDVNNTDRYPLMAQYAIPEFCPFLILPLFVATTLLTVTVYKRKHLL
jgi:parallel beta-helix repeat protein